MNYIVSIEGQSIPMPEEVAGDDAKIKAMLSPYFPGAANSKIMRSEAKEDTITITVIKQAGTKGAASILDKLTAAKEQQNPVVEMYQRMADVDEHLVGYSTERLMELDESIEQTIKAGTHEQKDISTTLSFFKQSPARPSLSLVEGF